MKGFTKAGILISGMLLAAIASLPAHADNSFRVVPGVYDPDRTRTVQAAWVTGQGLPDPSGKADHALFLQKNTATAAFVAAGADVLGVEGQPVAELGFDVRTGGDCTGGSPRFNLLATDGFHFIGGCGNGTETGSTLYNGNN